MMRSILVTEIFVKATKARIANPDDSAALTLMSTDMERIREGFTSLHETWASVVQAAFAAWMLYNQLGIVFIASITLVVVCAIALGGFINFTGDSQRAWMTAVQKRTGLTAAVIASMKSSKLSGLSAAVGEFVQKLRVEELAAGSQYRSVVILAGLFGFIPQLIGPPVTFAFAHQKLDVSTIFTCLAFLTLLTGPLGQLFGAVPMIVSAVACIGRIQAFLECEDRHDFREILSEIGQDAEKPLSGSDITGSGLIIQNGRFGWEARKPILHNVNARIPGSSLTMVVGPVGSGKSTFCKAILGEIPFNEGRVILKTRLSHVGLCEQTTFLSNGSIKENIIGYSAFDKQRYLEVIYATALDLDLATFPQGDQTNIGSDGITLSGGQKQRVSLARALYLQSDLLVLDDVFSGLDADTERHVFQRVFSADGLLRRRGSTTILCTHSVRHLPVANHIIVLGEGTVVEQGSFRELMANQSYVKRLALDTYAEDNSFPQEHSPSEHIRERNPRVFPIAAAAPTEEIQPVTDVARQVGDKTVYMHYIKSMGWVLAALGLFFAILWGFFTNFPSICKSLII